MTSSRSLSLVTLGTLMMTVLSTALPILPAVEVAHAQLASQPTRLTFSEAGLQQGYTPGYPPPFTVAGVPLSQKGTLVDDEFASVGVRFSTTNNGVLYVLNSLISGCPASNPDPCHGPSGGGILGLNSIPYNDTSNPSTLIARFVVPNTTTPTTVPGASISMYIMNGNDVQPRAVLKTFDTQGNILETITTTQPKQLVQFTLGNVARFEMLDPYADGVSIDDLTFGPVCTGGQCTGSTNPGSNSDVCRVNFDRLVSGDQVNGSTQNGHYFSGTFIRNQFSNAGVVFSSNGNDTIATVGEYPEASSPPNFLVGFATGGNPDSLSSITATIVNPQTGALSTATSIDVTIISAGDAGVRATAYNPQGGVVQSMVRTGSYDGRFNQQQLSLQGPNIARVVFERVGTAAYDGFGIDDFRITAPFCPGQNPDGQPQCSDGIDNTDPEDTVADYNDPGCYDGNGRYNPNDTDETDNGGGSQTGCINVLKETFNTVGSPISPVAQFTFRLDNAQTAVNDGAGNARFENVSVGLHRVTELLPTGWTNTSVTPANGYVTVVAGTCVTAVFKNKQNSVVGNPYQNSNGYDYQASNTQNTYQPTQNAYGYNSYQTYQPYQTYQTYQTPYQQPTNSWFGANAYSQNQYQTQNLYGTQNANTYYQPQQNYGWGSMNTTRFGRTSRRGW